MKKILVIGAGFLQTFIIKKARIMGYHVFAVDKNPESIGFEFAHEYKIIDIVDKEACLDFAQSKGVDGVITAATDYGVLSAAYIAEKMDLPGLDYEVAKLIKNKFEVRKILSTYNVDDVNQFYEVESISDIRKFINNIKYPIMVKPCDGSGSKATKRVDSANDLKEACEDAIAASLIGRALIEDFIKGKEYGVESFVYKGEVHVLGVLNKYMTNHPNYAELGHSAPSHLKVESKIKEVVKNAIKVLGINYGAINMDILVTNDERVCIIDIGARMGGNLIGSHLIPITTNFDYIGTLIQSSAGDLVEVKISETNSVVVTKILALKPGKVTSLPNFEEVKEKYQILLYHNLTEETIIREYRNNLDGNGYIVAVSDNFEEAWKRSEEAKNFIDSNIERLIN